MTPEIPIRNLGLHEVDVAARFFHEHWRKDHIFSRNHELLLWMFHDAPAASQSTNSLTIKAAFDGNEVVGFFGYIPFFYNHYGRQLYGTHLSTWWVKPEYRRSPLGLRLMRAIQYEMGFNACVAGMITPVAEKFYKIAKWQWVDNIPRWVFVARREALLDMFSPQHSGSRQEAENFFEKSIFSYTRPKALDMDFFEVRELKSLNDLEELGWDEFYWRAIAPNYMSPARTTATLIWRYQAAPIFTYKALAAFHGNDICGLLIYRLEQVKYRSEWVMRIVDICSSPKVAYSLLDKALSVISAQNIVLSDFFCTNTIFDEALQACGFIRDDLPSEKKYRFPYLFQPLDVTNLNLNAAWWIKGFDMEKKNVPDNFFLTKGDYEFDRPN